MPWKCAHGDAPTATLDCDKIVNIGAVDTNTVRIAGRGFIHSFGPAPVSSIDGSGVPCSITVIFQPDGGDIALDNKKVSTLSGEPRLIDAVAIGIYSCDAEGDWMESGFWETGERETSRRIDALEERLANLESKRAK